MQIDWFTIFAQILNFLILIALLKHFFYQKIIDAMDEREQKIANRLEEAESKKEKAEEKFQEYRKKEKELDNRKDAIMNEAKDSAESRKRKLLVDARRQAEELQKRWKESLREEKTSFIEDIRRKTGSELYRIAKKSLKELADEELENQLARSFIKRLENITEEKRGELSQSFSSGKTIQITTRFELSETHKKNLKASIGKLADKKLEFRFENSPEVIGGIELVTDGKVVAWSIEKYLEDLQQSIQAIIEEQLEMDGEEKEKEQNNERTGKK
ncbi:MAG: F0F1 ATP synthase subunit delta [Vulcanimicrobiota bacterium]